MTNTTQARLVYMTRRAYETGKVTLVLRTDRVWDERDTGWQLLSSEETGLELSDPSNGLLLSVERAIAHVPALLPLLADETEPVQAAYAYDDVQGIFLPTQFPQDPPTD